MDKSEVIILSSDDESDINQSEDSTPNITVTGSSENSANILKALLAGKKRSSKININWSIKALAKAKEKNVITSAKSVNKENPEIVDLVDCLEKSPSTPDSVNQDTRDNESAESTQKPIKLDVIDIDTAEDESETCLVSKNSNDGGAEKTELRIVDTEAVHKDVVAEDASSSIVELEEISEKTPENNQNASKMKKRNSSKNLKAFTEFVELCGSLETIESDRIRLTKKLMKRYGEADSSYIGSPEFGELIQKCRERVNADNLYLIAKDITAELGFRKQIDVTSFISEGSQIQRNSKNIDTSEEKKNKKIKKHSKLIKKILKKLDKLGSKIRELEVEEVDLSDEEESSYIRLQRYRERFCQIYKKLRKYTNEIPDAEELNHRRICFTESKYPTINKCIEVWLNKVKQFPDFTDVMKLLESQSSSLGLPTNRESLRVLAQEIFQQVGAMLQRRRKYELWDSFCGFLEDQIDPACSDPDLERVLKSNFDARVKKEQEIFQHYSELQEKKQLEPEEVPEEKANDSPVESGNEDEQEIEKIENDILKKLDLSIKEITKKDGGRKKHSNQLENKDDPINEAKPECLADSPKRKQSKNNYKHCKSLKWKSEHSGKKKSGSGSSEDSCVESEYHRERCPGVSDLVEKDSPESNESPARPENRDRYDSDLESPPEKDNEENSSKKGIENGGETVGECRTVTKRSSSSVIVTSVKRKCINYWKSDENSPNPFHDSDQNENELGNSNGSFEIRYCQVFTNSVFTSISEKASHEKKKKNFRDMTNVNRLMSLYEKSFRFSGLFAPSVFGRGFREFEKLSRKRKYRANFQRVDTKNEKCALTQGGRTGKRMNSSRGGGESEAKDIRDSSERGGDEKDGFFSGHGGESHGGDEDRNRKNGRTDSDSNENKPEEEEEDEDDRDENEVETKNEAAERSRSRKKTQKTIIKTEWLSEILDSDNIVNSLFGDINNEQEQKKDPDRNIGKREAEYLKTKKAGVSLRSRKLEQKIAKSDTIESTSNEEKAKSPLKHSPQLGDRNSRVENESKRVARDYPKPDVKSYDAIETTEPSSVENNLTKRQSDRSFPDPDTKKETSDINEKIIKDCIEKAKKKKKKKSSKRKKCAFKARSKKKKRSKNEKKANDYVETQFSDEKLTQKNAPPTSDEDIVKRFLMHSPSSISITPPRKLSLPKSPSESALQALAALRNLKGISATLVTKEPQEEDDVVVIGGSYKPQGSQNWDSFARSGLPVISSVQSFSTSPKIATSSSELTGSEETSIKISSVWGSLPDNDLCVPGCSSQDTQQSDYHSWNTVKKKLKKKVEYIVLE